MHGVQSPSRRLRLIAYPERRGGGCRVTPDSLGSQLFGNCGHLPPPPTLKRPEAEAPCGTSPPCGRGTWEGEKIENKLLTSCATFGSFVGSPRKKNSSNKTFTTFLCSLPGGRGRGCGAESQQKSNSREVSNCLSLTCSNLVDGFFHN